MLLWPPTGPVVFGPNPVEGLNISEEQGRLRLRLRVVGPVDGDIMVFGATPCSTGRKKWRNGAFLGLLPAPVGGESDITELYVARHGEPEPGKRVFIRTRQQREGWKDHSRNVHEVVLAKAGAAGVEILTWHSQNQNETKLRHRPESQFRETRGLLVPQCQCSCLRRCL